MRRKTWISRQFVIVLAFLGSRGGHQVNEDGDENEHEYAGGPTDSFFNDGFPRSTSHRLQP